MKKKNAVPFRLTLLFFFLVLLFPLHAQEPDGTEPAGENGYADEYDEYDDDEYDDYLDFGEDPGGITVTGTPGTTQQTAVIDKETIEKSGARDLAALLEEELNMSVTGPGGYGNQSELNMRGFDTERIAILIDGIPANSPRSGDFDMSQINLDNVERVEIIYGASDTKYNVSGAMGGVINIITVRKQKPGLNFGFTLSNTGYMPGRYNRRHANGAIGDPEAADLFDMQTLSLSAGYGAEKFSWKASLFGDRAGNHYLYRDDYGFARRKAGNEVLDGGGDFQLAFTLPKDASLLTDTKLYYARRNFPVTMNSTGSALASDLLATENVVFAAPVIFRDDLAAEASLSYQTSLTSYADYSSGHDHYLTAINRWNWYPSLKATLRTGIDWRFLYINKDSPTETEPVKTGNQGGLYITGEYQVLENLLITASVKGVTDTKQAAALPKLGLSWQARPFFTLRNNYFRSFRFPGFDDLYYRSLDNTYAGNPALKPEDGWGADIGGELAPNEYFSLDSTVYWQWIEDSIRWIKSPGGRWSPENVGTACFAGGGLGPAFNIPFGGGPFTNLKIRLDYQFQLNWLLNGDLDFASGFRVPYMPNHILGASVDLAWKTGSVFVSAHYESTRYADTLNELVLAPHCVVHATVNQEAGKNLAFFVSLRNILNTHYESFAGYHMPGISLVCGVRTKFDFEKTNSSGNKNADD